jgi:hypothetical protein
MKKIAFAFVASMLAVAGVSLNLLAADTATQKFTVSVPQNIAITAPANASITHDETDNNQPFSPQAWTVRGNTLAGVNVSFATATPFVHTTDSSFKRNAKLDLAVASSQGPATWTVTKATDTTDYGGNDMNASVTATSNGVGRATMNVSVTFITDTFGTFAAGSYEATVTGTVAAN